MQTLPIGILGGTFDPIHLGHIHLATTIKKLCCLQKILLVPCFQSPLRNPPIASAVDRINMVKLAINDHTCLFADDCEIKLASLSYAVETIRSLRLEYVNIPLTLIMSIDAFNRFDEWHEWQSILEVAHLIISNRPGFWQVINPKTMELLHKYQTTDKEQLQKQLARLIYLANIAPLPISATQIRALIKERKDASHLVTSGVWQYICKKHLYT
jgi:nicotinate-nucleotide adenylyltransferase